MKSAAMAAAAGRVAAVAASPKPDPGCGHAILVEKRSGTACSLPLFARLHEVFAGEGFLRVELKAALPPPGDPFTVEAYYGADHALVYTRSHAIPVEPLLLPGKAAFVRLADGKAVQEAEVTADGAVIAFRFGSSPAGVETPAT